MEQMNYDEADLFAIEHGAAANGIRLDEGSQSSWLANWTTLSPKFTKSNTLH